MSETSPNIITFKIRPALLSECPILVDMQRKMCMETEGRELKAEIITRGVQRAFERPEFGASVYVAEPSESTCDEDGRHEAVVAAMMMNTTEWDIHRNGMIVWFQSVYVGERFRRRGIFRHFFSFVKNKVQNDPACCSIRLDVDRGNENAQSTYKAQQMYLEGVRIARFTKPGVEPEEAKKSDDPDVEEKVSKQERAELTSSQLPDLNPAIRIRRVTPEEIRAHPSLLDEIANIQFESSNIYFPTSFPSAESHKKNLEKTKQGLAAILLQEHDETETKNDEATHHLKKKIGAEVYVAQLVQKDDAPSINIGSVVFTFEWSDWRDGLVLNCFGTFAVLEQHRLLRRECFRSFFRHFRDRTLSDPDVSGFRFSYEEAVESKLEDARERIDEACVEEGMFVERYYLMRFDK